MVHCAGHGGLWLSQQRVAQLPPEYEPYLGDKQWAEEDEDAGIALQYLGLLSLIDKDINLEITEFDITIGKTSRKDYYGTPWIDGPLVEAYKQQTGDNHDEMICANDVMSPRPGGFKLIKLSQEAQTLKPLK